MSSSVAAEGEPGSWEAMIGPVLVLGMLFYGMTKARKRGMTLSEWVDWHRLVDIDRD